MRAPIGLIGFGGKASTRMDDNMQNKPNSCRVVALAKTGLNPYLTRLYQSMAIQRDGKNNEKTNPNKPNSNPIQIRLTLD
jgi:hypothetical protein